MEDSLLFHLGFDPVFLLLGLLIFIIILFVLVISMHMKYNRLKSSYNAFMKGKDGRSMEKSITDRLDEIDNLSHMAKLNRQNIKEIYRRLEGNYQKIVKGESYVELSSEETESLEKAIFQEAYALKDIVDVKK